MKVRVDQIMVSDMDVMETIVKALEKDDGYEVILEEHDGFDHNRNVPTGKREYYLTIFKKVKMPSLDADAKVGF